jgi:Flp pilus assembly protein TadG
MVMDGSAAPAARGAGRSEQGQVVAFVVVALVGLLGVAALVTDVGIAWYAKRQLQASVDAAALAGAQDLPDVTTAVSRAGTYITANVPSNLKGDTDPPTITSRCTATAAACVPANEIVVTETAHVPTIFARVLGFKTWNIKVTADACQPCGTAPADIVMVVDRTGSMCSPTGANGECIDLDNAKSGIRALLSEMEPDLDRIGLVSFPPVQNAAANVCGAPYTKSGSDYYDAFDRGYVTDPLSTNYRNANGTPNMSSGLYLHTMPGNSSACIRAGGNTSYDDALLAGEKMLLASTRYDTKGRKIPQIEIFMTDGEANLGAVYTCTSAQLAQGCVNHPATGPSDTQPCHTAINAATAIKQAGITIYTIGYDLRDPSTGAYTLCTGGSVDKTGTHLANQYNESPQITSYSTLQQIASAGDFYNKPTAGNLDAIFTAIAADITQGTSRLVDDGY